MVDVWSILTPEQEALMRERAAMKANGPHLHVAPPEARPHWPEPKPIETSLPSVKSLDPELLPEALRDYVFDVSDRQQSPPDFAAVAGICGIATLAGNEVRIRPKGNDDWEVTPNLWACLIGRPSAMKSPAMRAALAPVYSLQERARTDWETAKKEREIDAALHGIGAKEAAKKATKAMNAGDRERARHLLAEHMNGSGDEAPCPRLIVNDATVEKLGVLLNENKHGVLLIRDELAGFLARLDAEDAQSERAFYLEAFNGDGAFTYDRIGRGTIHIEHATVSIIGGIQPSRVAPLVRGAVTGTSDDGLLQRFQLAVWPDDLHSWTWTDRLPNARARIAYEAAFQAVETYARNLDAPAVFQFSAEAQDLFRQWMIELQTEARGRKLPGVYESHLLKMPKTVAGLALVFELIEGGRERVGVIATRRALDWADYLKSHASRLYAGGAIMAENGARLISERRDQLAGRFTARDIQRKAWAGLYDRHAVADALDLLVNANHVRANAVTSSDAGGRPSTIYEWNPKLGWEG